jgi:hypothetical protein
MLTGSSDAMEASAPADPWLHRCDDFFVSRPLNRGDIRRNQRQVPAGISLYQTKVLTNIRPKSISAAFFPQDHDEMRPGACLSGSKQDGAAAHFPLRENKGQTLEFLGGA